MNNYIQQMTYKEAFMMKKMTKTFGAIALTLGLLTTTTAANAAAYDTTSLKDFRTVHTHATVYAKPSETASKVGSLRNTEAVVIERTLSDGWTKVRFGFDTAYVKTSALKKAQANTKTVYAKNISKKYTFVMPQNKGSEYNTRFTATFKRTMNYNDSAVNFWFANSQPDAQGTTEYDTAKGLYVGNVDTGKLELALKYPVKKGTTFKGFDGKTSKVIATKQKRTVNGKSYGNVVVVKNGTHRYFYAPQVGLVEHRVNDTSLLQLHTVK